LIGSLQSTRIGNFNHSPSGLAPDPVDSRRNITVDCPRRLSAHQLHPRFERT
jgi:hypothetical protein